MLSPIILFVYNRPEHTRKTVEALQKNELAQDSLLYIFADGAKPSATEEQRVRIQETRDYVHTITGFKNVFVEEAPTNKGLANSVIDGVTKIINDYGRVIVVEDDIETHPYFLRFMNDCLDVYQSRKDVFMIGGFSVNIKFPWWYYKDIYAVYRSCSWGWATWKERWEKADWGIEGYEEFLHNETQIRRFCRGGNDMYSILQAQMEGKICSWAIRWDYCMLMNNAICIRPVKSLCICNGFDGSGVHCGELDRVWNNELYPLDKEYSFALQKNITVSWLISDRFARFYDYGPSISQRVKLRIRRLLLRK